MFKALRKVGVKILKTQKNSIKSLCNMKKVVEVTKNMNTPKITIQLHKYPFSVSIGKSVLAIMGECNLK